MRVVHYSTRLGRSAGGLYHSVSGLARAQADLGADVTVVGGREARFEDEKSVWGTLPLLTHTLDRSRYGFSPSIVAEIARLKPDILHVHGIWSASSIYGRFAPRRTQVVVSPRGMLDPWILGRNRPVKAIHASLFERPLLARAHLHALSAHEAASVHAYAPAIGRRTFILPNGISSKTSPATSDRSGALYLGRLHDKKQVLPLIDAWEAGTRKLKLKIAGWGTPDYERQVAQACAGKKRVHFAGPVYGPEKDAAFTAAEFFVLPSLSEGLPIAALEALSYGCIPILTDGCHLPDLFTDDAAMRMAPDFSDFAQIVHRLETMSPAEKSERSARARHAAQRYLWPDIARRMLDRYADILRGPQQ